MEEMRKIPKKNYVILGVVIVVTLFVLYYFYMWVDAYNSSKLNESILDKYMTKINYNELDNFLVENPNSIIYVSVLEDENIRNFEKKFRGLFKNKKLNNTVLYMDITDEITNQDIVNDMSKYSINGKKIYNVPVIMVIENGKIKDIYDINVSEYDINNIRSFINEVEFASEVLE